MSNTKYHTARLTCHYYGGEQVVGGSSWLNGLTKKCRSNASLFYLLRTDLTRLN